MGWDCALSLTGVLKVDSTLTPLCCLPIQQKLRKHDESCTYAMDHFLPTSKSSSNKRADQASPHKIGPSSSYDTAETVLEESLELEWKECPICMEDFKPNEIVSWSPDDQTSCQHFFHHECIKGM